MKQSEKNINLIIRSLKNELSEQQRAELSEWLYSNSDNQKQYYKIKDIWDTLQFDKIRKDIHTRQDWKKLMLEFDHGKHQNREKKISRYSVNKILQIAAIIIVTFGLGFFVNYLLPEQQEYTTVNVPYGAKTQLDLPDGSKIWVNSGSSLTYPININQKDVSLYLDGEAYFDISKIEGRKLHVKTSTITVQVHATAFNVRSYENDDFVETTLVRGSISLTGSVGTKLIEKPIVLKPNQQAVLTKGDQDIRLKELKRSDEPQKDTDEGKQETETTQAASTSLTIKEVAEVNDYTSWKDNKLVFKSQRFDELLIRMERWYDVDIILEDKELSGSLYTGTFDKESIEQAMKALSMSLPFKYEIDKNRITIKRSFN